MQASAWAQEIRGAAGWVIRRTGGRNRGRWALFRHYSVARQTRELGVRVALGAGRAEIAGSVLGRGLRVSAVGIGVGAVLAIVASRFFAQERGCPMGSPDVDWFRAEDELRERSVRTQSGA